MLISDPIADMLTRIRNANTAKHDTVDIPASKIKVAIAGILVDEGFIEKYDIVEDGKIKTIHVTLKYGADKLSDSELLAILLRTGTKGKSVIEMAEEILKSAGGTFKGLAGKDIDEITKIPGVKNAKVVTIAAALEI